MKSLVAFTKKEFLEQIRSGRLLLIGILFVVFGIMNPAVAKLTPWILEMFSDSLAGSGMTVTAVTVSAMDSWVQFFKNVPMGLIAFVLLQSRIFTGEYGSGTLVLSLTKGLERFKVVLSKTLVLVLLWTAGYWLCYGITYFYNAYFWDNSVAKNLLFSAVCWWLFGLWVISMMVLFSTLAETNTGVLTGCGGVVLASYLVSMIPKVGKYLPTHLADGNSLIGGVAGAEDYAVSLAVTAAVSLICLVVSVPIFNKKRL